MEIDLEKIKKLPPDVKKDFMKMYLKLDEKKKILKVNGYYFSEVISNVVENNNNTVDLIFDIR